MGASLSQARLEDRYYLQKVKLGQGSFGTVWRAVDRQNNKTAAIKQLDKASMPRRGVKRQDIEREINVMQAVHHDNVIRLLDTFEDHSSIYLALEYCDGGDFGDKVKERGLDLEEHQAAEWMRQILSAIAALHAKMICHRDIKPDNFMVHGESIKLSDFGLAMFLTRGRLLTEKCGTPAFMAPEQHRLPRNSRGYTHAVDTWAAGVTMYMLMFGGKHPFLSPSMQIDEKRLLQGSLDFNVAQTFFSFGMPGGRFSEPARRLCRKLVEPDMAKRLSVEDASQDPWLRMARSSRQGGQTGAAKASSNGAGAGSGASSGKEAPRSQGWWPFNRPDENVRPNGPAQEQPQASEENEAILRKRIEMLEEQVRVQQEQNESQWEALVNNQQLQEKQRLAQRQAAAAEAKATGANLLQQKPIYGKSVTGFSSAVSPVETMPDRARKMVLEAGTKCCYHSCSWSGWMPAVVQSFNAEDGTYDLDVRQHAQLENISPAPDVLASEAWPAGALVYYESSTVKHWLPAVILSFNEGVADGPGTYNLDVRECAQVDRMRPRLS
uniref:Protein kinase domain-containing protein n=2 Tax=Alexandrium monilatum TaxID=311494 RepID=A0A7S4RT27_9DINO